MILVDEKEEVSIRQLTEDLVKAFDFKGEVVYDSNFADGQYKKTASNAKLRKYLPNFQFTPFEVAIKESVEWYKTNSAVARN